MSGKHTKRSREFRTITERLIRKLEARVLTVEDHVLLRRILQDYTTDNPCIVKSKDDEPIFVLRGQDSVAPEAVEFWACQAFEPGGSLRPAKVADAMECAANMRAYPHRKHPD